MIKAQSLERIIWQFRNVSDVLFCSFTDRQTGPLQVRGINTREHESTPDAHFAVINGFDFLTNFNQVSPLQHDLNFHQHLTRFFISGRVVLKRCGDDNGIHGTHFLPQCL